ncbi:MAG: amino acid ABC transporter permease [Undibacterium curvum]|jgi:glutamate/aspartate transport system permease protein|uniref:Amino acid ABC transporter permease n=1 Tax=Undibacterium curvum TaxID=2762294 RepID=A0ABR7A2I8_9BURK|nr:amino acid ABC transporter permease [Undibacterium curvum]MBC3930928.1 amino acid ABC transporter permease [Undibacterium curvum]
MNYNWNWNIYWEDAPDGMGTYFDSLIAGLKWTLATAGTAWVLALVIGLLIGTLRTAPNKWIVRAANAYVELFRNIPLIVQMFLWYFVFPECLPVDMGNALKQLPNAPFVTAVLSLGFFTSARVAVQVSTGIQALPRGQRMAGVALGLTLPQTYRYVLLPMAFRIIIPSLTNEVAAIIKNSSVALSIGLIELTASARSMQEMSFQTFEAFGAATIIYLVVSVIAILLSNLLEKTLRVPGFIAAGSAK